MTHSFPTRRSSDLSRREFVRNHELFKACRSQALDKTIQPGFVGRVLWNDKGCSGRKFNGAGVPRTWPCPLQPLAVDRPGRMLSACPPGRAEAAPLASVHGLLFDRLEHISVNELLVRRRSEERLEGK